jgi:hypothetical protein
MATILARSYGHACRLRTGFPVAPPRVPRATRFRVGKAQISLLTWLAVKVVGLCRGQHDSKGRQSDDRQRELTHRLLPQIC